MFILTFVLIYKKSIEYTVLSSEATVNQSYRIAADIIIFIITENKFNSHYYYINIPYKDFFEKKHAFFSIFRKFLNQILFQIDSFSFGWLW